MGEVDLYSKEHSIESLQNKVGSLPKVLSFHANQCKTQTKKFNFKKNSSAEQKQMVEIAHIVCACVNVDTWVIQQTENGTTEVCVDCFLEEVNNQRLSRASTPELQS